MFVVGFFFLFYHYDSPNTVHNIPVRQQLTNLGIVRDVEQEREVERERERDRERERERKNKYLKLLKIFSFIHIINK